MHRDTNVIIESLSTAWLGSDRVELWRDSDRVLFRVRSPNVDANSETSVLAAIAVSAASYAELSHEFEFRANLDADWAVKPASLERGHLAIFLEDPGGSVVASLLRPELPLDYCLEVGVALSTAVAAMHRRGVLHRDLRPAHLLFDRDSATVHITGFGVASATGSDARHVTESDGRPGSFAYMAPEQAGRVSRVVDARSDLYSVGVILYELLTGATPFHATDQAEWMHRHLARKPEPPSTHRQTLPDQLSRIVLKLLNKTPESRYQTAGGLAADLKRCLDEWRAKQSISEFALDEENTPTQLQFDGRFYGRDLELDQMRAAFHETVETGQSQVILVSGFSGVGKSALVRRFMEDVASAGGRFAGGKFDQYKRNIPYAPLAEAVRHLVREWLVKPEAELQSWKASFNEALGLNGQLLVHLLPEIELILGPQAPLPDLRPGEARQRYRNLFQQVFKTFAHDGRPLLLFLDDLQWLDEATQDVFESLATHARMRNVTLVAAYRSNEMDAAPSLRSSLDVIRSRVRTTEIFLTGLGEVHTANLIAGALETSIENVEGLITLILEKTGENPFFTILLMRSLVESGMLVFDAQHQKWNWNAPQIRAQQASDSVVDLMIESLRRLPTPSLELIQTLACMGSRTDRSSLAIALNEDEHTLSRRLVNVLEKGLVFESRDTFVFSHDRIHEAAYGSLTSDEKSNLHLQIGKRLLESQPETKQDLTFDLVNQFNRVPPSMVDAGLAEMVAMLNLEAGRKARRSAAYATACAYLDAGEIWLSTIEDGRSLPISFAISLEHAECAFLSGELGSANELAVRLQSEHRTVLEQAAVARLIVEIHVVRSENTQAVVVALDALERLGISLHPRPAREQALKLYLDVWSKLDGRTQQVLDELPLMTDPHQLAAMQILAEALAPSYFTDFNLMLTVVGNMVKVSLEHGSCAASHQGFALLGWLTGPILGLYKNGADLIQFATEEAKQSNSQIDHGRCYATLILSSGMTRPLTEVIEAARRVHDLQIEAGDLYYACYTAFYACSDMLIRGHDLHRDAQECANYLKMVGELGFEDGTALIATTERTFASLRGLTRSLADFSDAEFDGSAFESSMVPPRMRLLTQWYWTVKTMLHFLDGNPEMALKAAENFNAGPDFRVHALTHLDYYYFSALAAAACANFAPEPKRQALRQMLGIHRDIIKTLDEQTGSTTFVDKHLLLSAEIARLDGLTLEAQRLYEQSACAAHSNGFNQCEAISNELAASFYEELGLQRVAESYLRDALDCYSRWGAGGKVRQLLEKHPGLKTFLPHASAVATNAASLKPLDVAGAFDAGQGVSSDVQVGQLVTMLMRSVVEHAGAERGTLMFVHEDSISVAARAEVAGDTISVQMHHGELDSPGVPLTLVRYVLRTNESIVVEDALADARFANDPHVVSARVRSMLALPIVYPPKLKAVLYLENNLAPRVFTQEHLAVLKLLSAQAAMSLQNAKLYRDLELRESKIRRIFDSNVIGIVYWDLGGVLLESNDAFLAMVGHDREELERGELRWFDMTPPEWRDQVNREVQELAETGALKPLEKEYFHKDGSRVPVLLSAALFEGGTPQQGIALIVDLRKQKAAESRAVDFERHNRSLHSELAHANRVATMGQLSAWIAHDVKQPLAGIVTSGKAGLSWLSASPPNVAAAERAFERMMRDGMLAANILDRTRAMVRKASPIVESVNVNEVVLATLALTASEAGRNAVETRLELDNRSPHVLADRIQFQQVILNLVVNAIEAMASESLRPGRQMIIRSFLLVTGRVSVEVEDSGPGLPPEGAERYFEAFYSTKPEGLGMGLAISRSIVESFGGHMTQRAAPGRGAVFHLELPPPQPNVLGSE